MENVSRETLIAVLIRLVIAETGKRRLIRVGTGRGNYFVL